MLCFANLTKSENNTKSQDTQPLKHSQATANIPDTSVTFQDRLNAAVHTWKCCASLDPIKCMHAMPLVLFHIAEELDDGAPQHNPWASSILTSSCWTLNPKNGSKHGRGKLLQEQRVHITEHYLLHIPGLTYLSSAAGVTSSIARAFPGLYPDPLILHAKCHLLMSNHCYCGYLAPV